MAYTLTTLTPVRQYVGTAAVVGTETPAVFGDVMDGSDATYTEIEAQYGPPMTSGVLSVDFGPIDAGKIPVAMHMQYRAKSADVYTVPAFIALRNDYYKVGDTSPYDSWSLVTTTEHDPAFALNDLVSGRQRAPIWERFYFLGSRPVDVNDPLGNTWLQMGPNASAVGWAARDALTTTGIRFDSYVEVQSNLEPRRAYLDIYEVRLVLAYEQGATGLPPLRQFPRDDLGRVWPVSSEQGSLRRLGGYY